MSTESVENPKADTAVERGFSTPEHKSRKNRSGRVSGRFFTEASGNGAGVETSGFQE